jgi:hypothetical protein
MVEGAPLLGPDGLHFVLKLPATLSVDVLLQQLLVAMSVRIHLLLILEIFWRGGRRQGFVVNG